MPFHPAFSHTIFSYNYLFHIVWFIYLNVAESLQDILPFHKWINDHSSDWWQILAVFHPNLHLTSLHPRCCLACGCSQTTISDHNDETERKEFIKTESLAYCETSVAGISGLLSSVLCCPSDRKEKVLKSVLTPKGSSWGKELSNQITSKIHTCSLWAFSG